MSSTDRFQILLAAISLVFLVFSTGLGVVIKLTARGAKAEERIAEVADDLRDLAHSTNDRLTWLERNRWGDPPGRARTRM